VDINGEIEWFEMMINWKQGHINEYREKITDLYTMREKMYSKNIPELTRFLNRNLMNRKLADIVAEFSAVSSVPLIEVYKMAGPIIGDVEACEKEIKRLEEF